MRIEQCGQALLQKIAFGLKTLRNSQPCNKPSSSKELQVDDYHQLHINVPPEMGAQFRVIVMPLVRTPNPPLSEDEAFNLAVYSTVTEDNPEEDAIWEEYVRT